jgi:hypothetical protein
MAWLSWIAEIGIYGASVGKSAKGNIQHVTGYVR